MRPNLRAVAPETEAPPVSTLEEEFRDFSYIVSHDLAASLRHVTAFSRLLIAELGEDLTPSQQSHAEHIRDAGEHCQGMIEQLLVFSRIQQKPLEKVRDDADQTLKMALLRLGASAFSADTELEAQSLGEVWADPRLLSLALRHLLDNALKFRRNDRPQRIDVRPAHDKGFWRAHITDNGPGVETAYREKAFRMFHRLHPHDGLPGVGAGLAICRRIARRHGGEVRFLDCDDDGARVELALPREPANSPKT